MNGSAPPTPCKEERGTAAVDLCTVRGNEGFDLLERTMTNRPPNEDRLRGIA